MEHIYQSPVPYSCKTIVGYADGCPAFGGYLKNSDYVGKTPQQLLSMMGNEWRCIHGNLPASVLIHEEYEV